MYSKKEALFKNTTEFIKNKEVISKIDVFYFKHEYTVGKCRIIKSWTEIGKVNFYYFYPILKLDKDNNINSVNPIMKLTSIQYKEFLNRLFGDDN